MRFHPSIRAASLLTATFPLGDLIPDANALLVRRGSPWLAALPRHGGPFLQAIHLATPSPALLRSQSQHVERGQVSAHPQFSIGECIGGVSHKVGQERKPKNQTCNQLIQKSVKTEAPQDLWLEFFLHVFFTLSCPSRVSFPPCLLL